MNESKPKFKVGETVLWRNPVSREYEPMTVTSMRYNTIFGEYVYKLSDGYGSLAGIESKLRRMEVDCDPDAGHTLDAVQPAAQEATMETPAPKFKVGDVVLDEYGNELRIETIEATGEYTCFSITLNQSAIRFYKAIDFIPYEGSDLQWQREGRERYANLQAENERLQSELANAQRVNSAQADEMVQARQWSTHLETKIRKLHHAVNLADTSRNEATFLTQLWNILNDIEEAD